MEVRRRKDPSREGGRYGASSGGIGGCEGIQPAGWRLGRRGFADGGVALHLALPKREEVPVVVASLALEVRLEMCQCG